jgi:biotin transport system substrate-specific component
MKVIATTLDRPLVRGLGASLVFAGLMTALAQITFRLPFTPVPVTLQVFGAVLSGMLLGSRLGALAQLEYMAIGLAGAPVFAGWTGGPAALLGPSGGYIPGFVLGAFFTGLILERCRKQDMPKALLAGAAGVAGIYLCGASWLFTWLTLAGKESPGIWAWLMGVAPFVGVDTLKVTFAAMITTGIIRWRK